MEKINVGRVILGGLVAGIVANLLGYLVDGFLLGSIWNTQMNELGRPDLSQTQIIEFNLLGLVTGVVLIWIYAAIRPRFGAGVMTAVYAGVAVWVVGVLIPNLSFMWVMGFFGRRLTAYTTAGSLVEIIVGAIAGAALYKE
ncbi:MAG: hypothetical protein ABR906_00905 [Terracidiphilus sp.]|jgi:hypothetical protein